VPKRKVCFFCANKNEAIDYKNPEKLRNYVSDMAKIDPAAAPGLALNISALWQQQLNGLGNWHYCLIPPTILSLPRLLPMRLLLPALSVHPCSTTDSVTRIEVKLAWLQKRTYQPKKIPRKREHGFLKRMSTRGGRDVLKARRQKRPQTPDRGLSMAFSGGIPREE